MPFRFRRSFRLGGVKLNVTKNGLSSISLGGRGASLNIPVARSGGIRGTVGIPGSGLSYSQELKTQPASHSGPPDLQNIDLNDAQIDELASTIASQEAEMAAAAVEANNYLNGPEYKSAQEILANPEVRSAEEILAAQALMDSCEGLELTVLEGHALIEERKETLEILKSQSSRSSEILKSQSSRSSEILKSQSSRSSKLEAANIENRKMIGPIFAAFGGLLLLLFIVGAISATFSTTQIDCSEPNTFLYSEQCTSGDGRKTLN